MKTGRLILIVVTLALCGCMPVHYSYWAPVATGGKLVSSQQSGSSMAPPTTRLNSHSATYGFELPVLPEME